jgi:chloramphenicol-sensitive protein RarD
VFACHAIGDCELTIVNPQLILSPHVTPTSTYSPTHSPTHREAQIGLVYGVAAYAWWGLIPIYFKLVAHIPSLTVLAHRVIWSFGFCAVLLMARPQWQDVRAALRNRKTLLMLAASAIFLASNWGVFIYAVSRGLVLQSSLGYFIVPLVSIALAVIVLNERLRWWQSISVALACVGVGIIAWERGMLPWISIVMAISWGSYALVRKVAHVTPLVGVAIETAMLTPFALAYLAVAAARSHIALTPRDYALLILCGVVTGLPLFWFASAARRLRLTTLGFLQYGAPIGQFLLAVFAYGEPFGKWNLIGFTFIWAALLLYTIDSLRAYRASTAPAQPEPELPVVAEI